MCFDPNRVKTLISYCQKAYEDNKEELFDKYIAELEEQLKGIVISGDVRDIDTDALIHSFI